MRTDNGKSKGLYRELNKPINKNKAMKIAEIGIRPESETIMIVLWFSHGTVILCPWHYHSINCLV